MKHISYRRVSTDEQGVSGLGLEAQLEQIIRVFGEPEIDFVEVETGKENDRPKLQRAIQMCKNHGYFLSVAKQDRLSRDTFLISSLMREGVDFKAADNPSATTVIKHIYAALAEDEVKKISERTKAALLAKKMRGEPLGYHAWKQENKEKIYEIMDEIRQKRVYPKPDRSKIETLKILKNAGTHFSKISETAELLFGRPLSKSTIYNYLQS